MLQFYYDFLDVFIDRSDFELGHMDTDSLYFAISNSAGESIKEEHERNKAKRPTNLSTHILDNIIKPNKRQDFHNMLFSHCCDEWDSSTFFFPRQCCKAHHVHDQKTPGLFKLEGRGHVSRGLSSKTYCISNLDNIDPKLSCKGINKRRVFQADEIFNRVLTTGTSESGINKGFRIHQNQMRTYDQERDGFTYFYCKRQVQADGIHTKPHDFFLSPISCELTD